MIDFQRLLDFLYIGVGFRVRDGMQRFPIVGIVTAFKPSRHVAHTCVISSQGHIHTAILVQQQPQQRAATMDIIPRVEYISPAIFRQG